MVGVVIRSPAFLRLFSTAKVDVVVTAVEDSSGHCSAVGADIVTSCFGVMAGGFLAIKTAAHDLLPVPESRL